MTIPTGEPHAGPATVEFRRGRRFAALEITRARAVEAAATAEQKAITAIVEELPEAFEPDDMPQTIAAAAAVVGAYARGQRQRAERARDGVGDALEFLDRLTTLRVPAEV